LRLWKTNPSNSKIEKLADFIKRSDLDHEETIKRIQEGNAPSDDPDIEENSGVEFPGY